MRFLLFKTKNHIFKIRKNLRKMFNFLFLFLNSIFCINMTFYYYPLLKKKYFLRLFFTNQPQLSLSLTSFFSHSSKNIKKPRSKDLPPYTFSSILSHVMIPSLTSYFPFFFCKNMEVTGATFGAVDCFFFLSFNLFRSSFVL